MSKVEQTMIVGLFPQEYSVHEIQCILEEMKLLTTSAGGSVVEFFSQKRHTPDGKYLIGEGKVEEIQVYLSSHDIDLVIFYNRLSNIQQRNLENFLGVRVIDRTRLILDVFASRARSLEGRLQVELAQLLYLLPRLTGKGIELSRLGGGIGTRGPGETKLEADRRTIKNRISIIKDKLSGVIKNRDIQRKNRTLDPVPVVSLVGYTSSGKSTLFKALTGEDVYISRMLFSTLDPVLRRVDLSEIEEGYHFLLSDTVGFIREMPRELFQAFKATLEEIVHSDIILHIIDISDPDYTDRKQDVQDVLEEMEIPESKVIRVFNKIDLLANYKEVIGEEETSAGDDRVYISAKEGRGLVQLKRAIFLKFFSDYRRYTISVPHGIINPDSLARWSIVLETRYHGSIVNFDILCSKQNMVKFKEKYGGYVK